MTIGRKAVAAALSAALVVFFAGTSVSWADEVVVKAEGYAPWNEDESTTKKSALDNALKESLLNVIKDYVDEELIADNESLLEARVYKNLLHYIMNYKIVSMGWVTHFDMPHLAAAEAAKAEEAKENEPSLIDPVANDTGEVIDPGADEVDGASSGKVEDEEEQEEDDIGLLSRGGGVNAYHIWVEATVDSEELKNDINRLFGVKEAATSIIELVVFGLNDYPAFEEFKETLMLTEVVNDITYKAFSRGKVVLSVEINGVAEGFGDKLNDVLGERYAIFQSSLAERGRSTDTFIIKPLRRKS